MQSLPITDSLEDVAETEKSKDDTIDQNVHLLLDRSESNAYPLDTLEAGTVIVMGPHKSGTHAMLAYLEQFFDVCVQPERRTKKRKCDGMVEFHESSPI